MSLLSLLRCLWSNCSISDQHGEIYDYSKFTEKAHSIGAMVAVAADLLSLSLLTPPGEWGADIVLGSSQRFGTPMGFGGPHAAFFSTKEEFKETSLEGLSRFC